MTKEASAVRNIHRLDRGGSNSQGPRGAEGIAPAIEPRRSKLACGLASILITCGPRRNTNCESVLPACVEGQVSTFVRRISHGLGCAFSSLGLRGVSAFGSLLFAINIHVDRRHFARPSQQTVCLSLCSAPTWAYLALLTAIRPGWCSDGLDLAFRRATTYP